MGELSLHARYLKYLSALNSANLVPSRIVLSPEMFYEAQQEVRQYIQGAIFIEDVMSETTNYLYGLPLVVDPRLEGNQVSLEIDI